MKIVINNAETEITAQNIHDPLQSLAHLSAALLVVHNGLAPRRYQGHSTPSWTATASSQVDEVFNLAKNCAFK